MQGDEQRLRNANAALEAWVRDLLMENRVLRERLARFEFHDEDVREREPAAAA